MAGDWGCDEKESDSDDQLGIKMVFNQQEMEKGSCQYAQNAKCCTLRRRMGPSIDIGEPDKPQGCNDAENDSYANGDDDQ